MGNENKIDPAGIVSPTQLLAAMFVLLLVVVPALITGAVTISSPSWAPAMFAVAAVAYVPLVILAVFRLLTRHRLKLLNDESVTDLGVRALELAPRVDDALDEAGFDIEALIAGRSRKPDSRAATETLQKEVDELVAVVNTMRQRDGFEAVPSEALLESAKGLMAQHRWAAAARYFDEYVKRDDSDWQVHFSRGVAHANTRRGVSSNIQAARAYGDAIVLAPNDADLNLLARLFTYRAAMMKRLGRLDEAAADLSLAQARATRHYEIVDLLYNQASVYAMMNRKKESLDAIRELRKLGGVQLVRPRVNEYFQNIREDPEFLRLIEEESGTDFR